MNTKERHRRFERDGFWFQSSFGPEDRRLCEVWLRQGESHLWFPGLDWPVHEDDLPRLRVTVAGSRKEEVSGSGPVDIPHGHPSYDPDRTVGRDGIDWQQGRLN